MDIVICDDNGIELESLTKYVKTVCPAHRVFSFCDGAEAAAHLEKNAAALLLTDIRMPFYSGLEIAALFRQRNPFGEIILISAYSEFSYAKEAIKLAVKEYLCKPIDVDELKRILTGLNLCGAAGLQGSALPPIALKVIEKSQNSSIRLSKRTRECISLVQQYYGDCNFSPSEIARRMFVSHAHLSDGFKKETGLSLSRFLQHYRLYQAENLVLNTTLPIKSVNEQCGFSNFSYFCNLFKLFFGKSPMQLRGGDGET